MKRILALATVAACVASAVPASAATIYKTVVIDLNNPSATFATDGTTFTVAGSVFSPALSVADSSVANGPTTLDFTILFAGNESITVTDADSFTATLGGKSSQNNFSVTGAGTLSLLGTSYTSASKSYNISSTSNLGQTISSLLFTGLPDSVTFTGLHYIGTVDYTGASNDGTFQFNAPSLSVAGANVAVAGSAVPETATWAMMLVGFGGIGGVLRSRRNTVKFA